MTSGICTKMHPPIKSTPRRHLGIPLILKRHLVATFVGTFLEMIKSGIIATSPANIEAQLTRIVT